MCILIAEIIMLLGGIYAMIAGKIKLTRNITLEGWRARVAGLFLIAPLILTIVVGFTAGILAELGVISADITAFVAVAELLFVLLGLIGVVVYAIIVKPKDKVVPEPDA